MANFMFPPQGFGPGTQPTADDGEELNYLAMPSGMQTFSPHIPYLEDPAVALGVVGFLSQLSDMASAWTASGGAQAATYDHLDSANQGVLREVLGEGEVSIVIEYPKRVEIQESVFTGIWRIMRNGREHIEIGAIPDAVLMAPQVHLSDLPQPGVGVVNAPAIITEILDHVENPQGDSHVINLTLLPHTPQDLDYLDLVLGRGGVTILSRGYGNCRIDRCAHPHIWRVRYYNSQDILILDTIEITDIPDVACAAAEDIRDTASRLNNVSEALT